MKEERGKRILIADDELQLRFSLALVLKKLGHRVVEAGDGREAFGEILRARNEEKPFDLLITDIQMSPSGGLELLDWMAERGIDLPVLVISGYLDEKLFAELVRRKVVDCMEKPLSLDDLVSRVKQLLHSGEKYAPTLAGRN